MRPPQLILLLLCLVFVPLFFTTFIRRITAPGHAGRQEYRSYASRLGRIRDLFFHAPSSLFPPSALISLTDDNSTFFLARPAAFGPELPSHGLDGQLWIGSGFGDDVAHRGGIAAKAEGELGCSDVPGWVEGNRNAQAGAGGRHGADKSKSQDQLGTRMSEEDTTAGKIHEVSPTVTTRAAGKDGDTPTKNDGTDDHLHHSLGDSVPPDLGDDASHNSEKNKIPTHADIQSLQESAEISGKVVLLSRGGCGFLEKTKWVQRRGGIAIIVGDNVSGGNLVTMYAHGDTSNVTIPAVFTSHTTAHILSSLIPPNNKPQESGSSGDKSKGPEGRKKEKTSTPSKANITPNPASKSTKTSPLKPKNTPPSKERFVSSLFSFWKDKAIHEDSRRPPSSGNIRWASQQQGKKQGAETPSKLGQGTKNPENVENAALSQPRPDPNQEGEDDFLIGIQDWRDPDLVDRPKQTSTGKPEPTGSRGSKGGESKSIALDGSPSNNKGFKGGSITPGSGEYAHQDKSTQAKGGSIGSQRPPSASDSGSHRSEGERYWWTGYLSWGEESDSKSSTSSNKEKQGGGTQNIHSNEGNKKDDKKPVHEGLWVTLAPTSMSTSPFFDTLLVLVVSPLITLTVVYALLLLRSRIRRRRWRAPKALVARLPVRTYHTITSDSNSSTPPRTAVAESATPSSPLLARSEPRSLPPNAAASSSLPNMTGFSAGTEKTNSGSTLWRRKYTSRQVECVVCLEEYVDGESKVMSLPCGHEFHAECITPWLTLRRRTCPICKGDVVRSMGNLDPTDQGPGSPGTSSSFDRARAMEDYDEFSSAAIPIPDHDNPESELRRSDALDASERSPWRGLTSLSLSALSGDSLWHQVRHTQNQRNR